MKKTGFWNRQLRLLQVLWEGKREPKDEYHRSVIQKNRYLLIAFACVLLLLLNFWYMGQSDWNKAQLASVVSMILVLLVAGSAVESCFHGTLSASDPFGGRLVFGLGCTAVAVHSSFLLSTKYQFGHMIFFWDITLVGILLYYLACNRALLAWETYQRQLDEAEELEEGNEAEDQRKQHAKKKWHRRGQSAAVLLLVVMMVPAWLGVAVSDDQIMEQAQAAIEAEEEALKTPAYLEYEALENIWSAPEEYIRFHALPIQESQWQVPVHEHGGVIEICTKEGTMTILFEINNGNVQLIQSNYAISEEADHNRAQFQYMDKKWMNREEWIIEHQQGTPGFEAETWWTYDLFPYSSQITTPKSMETILETQENGKKRLTYVYRTDYVQEQTDRFLSYLPGANEQNVVKKEESFLVGDQGEPVEFTCYYEYIEEVYKNAVKYEVPTVIRQASQEISRDGEMAREWFRKMKEQGPFVPSEALELYAQYYDLVPSGG